MANLDLQTSPNLGDLTLRIGTGRLFMADLQNTTVTCEECDTDLEDKDLVKTLSRARVHRARTRHEVSVHTEYGWQV